MSLEQKRALINPLDSVFSVNRQCELLGLARSSYYYEAQPESEYNLELMRLIDEQYLLRPSTAEDGDAAIESYRGTFARTPG